MWPKNRRNLPASEFFNMTKCRNFNWTIKKCLFSRTNWLLTSQKIFWYRDRNISYRTIMQVRILFLIVYLKFHSHKGSQWNSIVLQDSFLKLGCCFNSALLLLSFCLFCRSGWSASYYLPQKGVYWNFFPFRNSNYKPDVGFCTAIFLFHEAFQRSIKLLVRRDSRQTKTIHILWSLLWTPYCKNTSLNLEFPGFFDALSLLLAFHRVVLCGG